VFQDMEKWVEIRRKVLANQASKRAICREYKIHWDVSFRQACKIFAGVAAVARRGRRWGDQRAVRGSGVKASSVCR